jgi:hypothetical protein
MDADALLAAIAFPAQATLIGRLALTLGGTDYQAAYDDVLDITWTTNANINGIDTWDNQVAWADGFSLGGFDDWRLPSSDINGDTTVLECHGYTTELNNRAPPSLHPIPDITA